MFKYFILIITAAALICAVSSAYALDSGEKAPAFKLSDQFGKVWDSAALKNNVVVLIAANKESGRDMDPWVSKIKAKYLNKVQLIGLMDLHSIPGIARGIARSRIRKETSEPLMLDFGGEVSKAYQVNSKSPVVVVIDKDWTVKAVSNSEYSDKSFNIIANAIDTSISR